MHPSLVGLITDHEFEHKFVPVFAIKFHMETLITLINSIDAVSKSDDYKFGKLIYLIEKAAQIVMPLVLRHSSLGNHFHNFHFNKFSDDIRNVDRLQFSHVLSSFSDRVFNFFAIDRNSDSLSSAASMVSKFHRLLLDSIKVAILDSSNYPIDTEICSMIFADLVLNDMVLTQDLLFVMLDEFSNEQNLLLRKIILSDDIAPTKLTTVWILLVGWLRSSNELYVAFICS